MQFIRAFQKIASLIVLLGFCTACIAPGAAVRVPKVNGERPYQVRFVEEDETFGTECPDVEGHEVMRSQKGGACLVTSDGSYYMELGSPRCIRNSTGLCAVDLEEVNIDPSKVISIHRWDHGVLIFVSPGRAKSFIVCTVVRVNLEDRKVDRFPVRYYEEPIDVQRPPTGVRVTDVSPDGEWFCGYVYLKDWEINSWAYNNFIIHHLPTGEAKKVHRSHGEGKFAPL